LIPLDTEESSKHAAVADGMAGGTQFAGEPPSLREVKLAANPTVYVDEYTISDVMTVRSEATAEVSLALIRERNRFGIATAATTNIIVTTISNSISENPFCVRLMLVEGS